MRLLGYNKFWNRWDEIYDFPFLRKDYETIRVLTVLSDFEINKFNKIPGGPFFMDVQRGHYIEFKYINYNPDSFKRILQNISFIFSNLIWIWLRFFMMKIYHPLLKFQYKLQKFSNL